MIEYTINVLKAAIETNKEVEAGIRHNLDKLDMQFKTAIAIDDSLKDLHSRTYDLQNLVKRLEQHVQARKKVGNQ